MCSLPESLAAYMGVIYRWYSVRIATLIYDYDVSRPSACHFSQVKPEGMYYFTPAVPISAGRVVKGRKDIFCPYRECFLCACLLVCDR